jgi:transposase
MKRYSNDLRKKAIAYFKECGSCVQTATTFQINRHTIESWVNLKKEWKLYEVVSYQTRKSKLDYEAIKTFITDHPDLYNYEVAKEFNTSTSNIQRIVSNKLKFTRKKNKPIIPKLTNEKNKSFGMK